MKTNRTTQAAALLGMMGAMSMASGPGIPTADPEPRLPNFSPRPPRSRAVTIRLTNDGDGTRCLPAPFIIGKDEVLPSRQTLRHQALAAAFHVISGKYPGETRRERRILARANMHRAWKDRAEERAVPV